MKTIFATRGWRTRAEPVAAPPVTTLSNPGGRPASSASFPTASAVSGVCSEGLWTTEQPAASAGAIFTELSAIGKLKGVMIPTVPTGSRRIRAIPWSRWRVDPSRSTASDA